MEAFVPTQKRAETVQEERIDERLYRPYLNIQSEGVSFNREAFDNHFLYPLKGRISEEEFEGYQKQCDYIESTATAMTELARKGEGHIESDGTFVPKNDFRQEITDKKEAKKKANEVINRYPEIKNIKGPNDWLEEFFHQPLIKEFSWNLFTGFDIHFGPAGTSIMGLVGIITNVMSFSMSLKRHLNLEHSPEQILTQGICGNPTLFESDLREIGNFITDNSKNIKQALAQDIVGVAINEFNQDISKYYPVFMTILAVKSLLDNHPAFWIIRTLLTIVGLYLPSFLIGIVMLFSGLTLTEYQGKIFLFGSDYFPIK